MQYLGGFLHSFIYVDYGVTESDLSAEVVENGFKGYRVVGERSLSARELTPNGWRSNVPETYAEELRRFENLRREGFVKSPFGKWIIFDRLGDFDDAHGPTRFSLVLLCADGVAAYQALFTQNRCAPLVLALIQPGHAFGGNYTNFTDPDGFFVDTVKFHQPIPEYLACGSMSMNHQHAFWPNDYPTLVEYFDVPNGTGIWQKCSD